MQERILERLRKWIELAEEDGARGDSDALLAKLLIVRAEVESALGLGRKPALAHVRVEASGARLMYKYAFAAVLFIVALGLAVRFHIGAPAVGDIARAPDTGGGATVSSESIGSGQPGSEMPGNAARTDAFPSMELFMAGVQAPEQVQAGPPEGRKGKGGREVRIARRPAGASSEATAAALESTVAAPSASEPSSPPAPDGGGTAPSDAAGATAKAPKLDPLALLTALDKHFD